MNARSNQVGIRRILCPLLLVAATALFFAGCASPNVNPSKARSGTGYADFYCETNTPLSWEVAELDAGGQRTRVVFSSFDPLPERVLRLAFKPGRYHLRISFLNQVILDRGLIDVDIKDGLITPVTVVLADAGTTLVERKERSVGPTFSGGSGRNTLVGNYETRMWRVQTAAADPLPYKIKAQMPYAAPEK